MRKNRRENHKLGLGGSAQIVVLDVTCDQCEKEQFTARTLGHLEEEARAKGWVCTKKPGRDLCPGCARRLGARMPAVQGYLF